MANTITPASPSADVFTAREATLYWVLASDGTNETATIVYDSSVVAALAGVTDPLKSRILEIYGSCNAASTARVKLLWDASTDVQAIEIPCATNATKGNFRKFGGLINRGGTGITGDILITTTGLASGDTITLVLTVGLY